MTTVDLVTEEGLPVKLPSGAEFKVLTQAEVDYLNDRVQRYLADNHFVNVSDLQDVDRMLILEMLCFRWGLWISGQQNYFGEPIEDTGSLRRSVSEYSSELRQLKKMLGIDKGARDKQKGEDSVATYLENLRTRAKEFGVVREEMLQKGLELFMQLQALITLHDNTDTKERAEMACDTDDVLDWIRTVAMPEFNAIDLYFRTHSQRFWVKDM